MDMEGGRVVCMEGGKGESMDGGIDVTMLSFISYSSSSVGNILKFIL